MAQIKGNNNASGFGVPGTQGTAIKNVTSGPSVSPNMPVGPQLARQARSSYQQNLMGTGAPQQRASQIPQRAMVPPFAKAPPATGYQLMSGLPQQDMMSMNKTLGMSAFTELPGAARTGRAVETLPTVTLMGDRPLERMEDRRALGRTGRPDQPETFQTFAMQTREGGYDEGRGQWLDEGGVVEGGSPERYAAGAAAQLEDIEAMLNRSGGRTPSEMAEVDPEALNDAGVSEENEAAANQFLDSAAGFTSDGETIGFSEEKLSEAHALIDESATQAYEMGLQQLARQHAMMGMTGSGAQMVANNALLAQIYNDALQQHMALDLKNLEQMEIDEQEQINNALQMTKAYMAQALAGEQLTMAELNNMMGLSEIIGTEFSTQLVDMMTSMGLDMTMLNAQYIAAVEHVALQMFNDGWQPQQILTYLKGKLQDYMQSGEEMSAIDIVNSWY